jgi:hypothetical protein
MDLTLFSQFNWPEAWTAGLDLGLVWLGLKLIALVILLIYVVSALTFWVQVKRLEKWLADLKRYPLSQLAFLHLLLAAGGWVLALIIL